MASQSRSSVFRLIPRRTCTPRLGIPSRLQHHAQYAVDAEPGMAEAGSARSEMSSDIVTNRYCEADSRYVFASPLALTTETSIPDFDLRIPAGSHGGSDGYIEMNASSLLVVSPTGIADCCAGAASGPARTP